MENLHLSQIKKRRLNRRNLFTEKNLDIYENDNLKCLYKMDEEDEN